MDRLNKFKALKTHPYLGKQFNKLTKEEYDECIAFIKDNDNLNDVNFTLALNRWKLDQLKTKNHTTMWSLICESLVK